MQRRKTIPTKPRFDYAAERAYQLLIEWGFSSLPISPWKILEECSDRVYCLKLSEANRVVEESKLGELFKNNEEGASFRQRGDSVYVIIYDDVNVHNDDRIRWTIMHELGHIFLGHLDDFERTALNRGGLTDKEYGVLEVEAHWFAAEMFAPTPVMKSFAKITEDQLRVMCGLSADAAERRYNSLFENTYHPSTRYDQKILRNFSAFMRWDAPKAIYEGTQQIVGQTNYMRYLGLSRKCPECYSFTTDPEAKYCIYCGAEFAEPARLWFGMIFGEDDDHVRTHPSRRRFSYQIVRKKRDWEYDKFEQCPVCHNENISPYAEYCQICGHPLRNLCTKEDKAVSVKARYCPDCGAETSFKESYDRYEANRQRLDEIIVNEDWLEYDYWDYIISCVRKNRELTDALNCSRAFTDDDDKVYVISTEERHAKQLIKHKEAILMLLKQCDGVEYTRLEVYTL